MSNIPDILKKIIKDKKTELEEVKQRRKEFEKMANEMPKPLDFLMSLKNDGRLSVIAEIKKASPSSGIIVKEFDPLKIALAYQSAGTDAISVLTEKNYFHGARKFIEILRAHIKIPLLRKDFITDEAQIYETRALGADSFLLISAALDRKQLADLTLSGRSLGMEPLVEVHEYKELEDAISADAKIIGVNSRNLRTFVTDLTIAYELIKSIPDNKIKVAESGIKAVEDARELYSAGYNAILVGEFLMREGTDKSGKIINQIKSRCL